MNTKKTFKNGNLVKLVAFFMIAFIIVYAVTSAAHGRQSATNLPSDGDDLNINNDTDKSNGGNNVNTPTNALPQEFFHYITGKTTTQENYVKKPLCFVFDSNAQTYGYSNTYLTIEIPTENNKSRFLCFLDSTENLGKIGSIVSTRKYINSIAHAFGGVVVANSSDDSYDYPVNSFGGTVLDITEQSGFHYTEYNTYAYSNGELMSSYTREESNPISHNLPYTFCELGSDYTPLGVNAHTVLISFGDGNSTELSYSQENRQYTLMKNGDKMQDPLNNRTVEYDNVFILMCDSATKETSEFTETVMLTDNGGYGYYISRGKAIQITWQTNSDGTITFLNENGEKLAVNRGTSYIAYVKSSKPQNVKIL